MKFILNSPVMTSFGCFEFRRYREDEAIEWLEKMDWESAVGHESTADFMTERLGVHVPFHRRTIRMRPGDEALVLRIMSRLPQGLKLSGFDMQAVACEFGLVLMLK